MENESVKQETKQALPKIDLSPFRIGPKRQRHHIKSTIVKSIKPRFKFIRNEHGTPKITICSFKDDCQEYVGVAICSDRDQPSKATGTKIALDRAVHAYCTKKNTLPIRRQEVQHILNHAEPAYVDPLIEYILHGGNSYKSYTIVG